MSNHTPLEGAVALVSGANRIYAAARNPHTLAALAQSDARVVPIALGITDDTSVQQAATRLVNVDLLVNNAGV